MRLGEVKCVFAGVHVHGSFVGHIDDEVGTDSHTRASHTGIYTVGRLEGGGGG